MPLLLCDMFEQLNLPDMLSEADPNFRENLCVSFGILLDTPNRLCTMPYELQIMLFSDCMYCLQAIAVPIPEQYHEDV